MGVVLAGLDWSERLDQRTFLRGLSWQQYEQLLRMKGDRAVPRLAYLDGTAELMTPSVPHEFISRSLGRLFEAYAEENGIDLNALGSWTLRKSLEESGVEPDGCYVFGEEQKEVPDLAIEVVWTSGGIDKLEIYRRLGVREVWFWQQERIQVYRLKRDRYIKARRSGVAPDLDLALICQLSTEPNQSKAVRKLRQILRAKRRTT